MAKTKYTPELVEIMVKAIEENGLDKFGIAAGKIGETTFYKWMSINPEFKAKILQARRNYSERVSAETKLVVRRNVEEYAKNGTAEKWETIETLTDAEGKVINRKHTKRTINRAAPWAIERVLGKPLNELDAIKILVENNWLSTKAINEIENEIEKLTARIKEILQNGA